MAYYVRPRRVLLLGISDGLEPGNPIVPALCDVVKSQFDITPVLSKIIFRTESGKTYSPALRAKAIMEAFAEKEIDAIFDLSGGDAANAVLPFLHFSEIQKNPKPFFGYSDLSVLLNPLHQLANIPVFYFQARFLATSPESRLHFQALFSGKTQALFPQKYTFLQGETLSGTIAGGNIRCTLKLMGTPWQPDFTGKILFLESCSGNLSRIETMLWQYRQIGAFSQCNGILLGNFTELSKNGTLPQLYPLIQGIADNPALPIVYTTEIGHQPESLCFPYHIPLHLKRTEHK